MPPLAITAFTATCAAGRGLDALAQAMLVRKSGLVKNAFGATPLPCWIGRVAGIDTAALPARWKHWESRNNRLAWIGLHEDGFAEKAGAAIERYGAARVALVLGTSTSSIGETERAYRELEADGRLSPAQRGSHVHQTHSLSAFVQSVLAIGGPCLTIATACSSSAKVFACAERLLRTGLADAAIIGGVDSLCGSVLYGFNSLELVSPQPCRPFDADRSGLSLGEAAGFALLENIHVDNAAPRLTGYGESSDAHHMSAPHPQGLGAQLALVDALARAGLDAADVDYINLHGTASRQNDEVEAALIARIFPATTLASSTKGWSGHCLGAAGIVEAVVALLAIERGFVPGTLNAQTLDPACGPQIVIDNRERGIGIALSNSFGFGGNNSCLAFAAGRA
ncbi:MAG: beta-ketoacyl-[acyl-carrier-protein] synthase family protein [Rudaea sp.]|nr:beta-ketoacyl-[acyl-carrier-protein] synthase family protein [Rudaea sp.]